MQRTCLSSALLALFLIILSCKKEEGESVVLKLPDPDPISDGFYGAPFQGLPQAVNDWVLYEVNLRAFSTQGDLQGIEERLDSIRKLGVNVIWLMPIHPIGSEKGINSPYCIRDYRSIASEYGALEDLRSLINGAHQRGMAVIMDFVANHTAWDHPWVAEHPDWYTQVNGHIVHPPGTNWLDVADLNFFNQDMQNAQIENMKFWIREANIDGYRCDYANGVPSFFWQRAIDSLEAYHRSDLIMLAEGDRADLLNLGFDLRFSWAYYAKLKEVFTEGKAASQLLQLHQNEHQALSTNQGMLRFITNHDESAWDASAVQIFGSQDHALAAMVATTFLGGIPLIYGSQEVGRSTNLPFFTNDPINWNANPEILKQYQQFMAIYSEEPAARAQSLMDYSQSTVLAFSKTDGNEELLILVNTSSSPEPFQIPSALTGSSWTNLETGANETLSNSLSLAASAYRIYKRL